MIIDKNIMYDSICDLTKNDFLAIYGGENGKNEVQNLCANCKWNSGICNCEVHAKAIDYIEDGKGVIVSCGMYEKQLSLAEVQKKWAETLRHADNSDDCAICEYRKKCFFASYGYGEGHFPCVWETVK